jgi:hypothetical protein
MQCGVCTGAAKDITPPGFDGIVIRCPTCKDYEIAGGAALARFRNASVEERAAALKKAKAFQGLPGRPTITTTCL